MQRAFIARFRFATRSLGLWSRWVLVGWTALGVHDLFLSQVLPDKWIEHAPRLADAFGQAGWELWLVVFLVIIVAAQAEAGFRLELSREVMSAKLEQQLDNQKTTGKLTDEDIVERLSPRAKALMTSFEKDLVSGQMPASGFDPEVVAQMAELELTTIAYGTPGPNAIARYAVPYLNLTVDGGRILGKIRGYQAPPEARTPEDWRQSKLRDLQLGR